MKYSLKYITHSYYVIILSRHNTNIIYLVIILILSFQNTQTMFNVFKLLTSIQQVADLAAGGRIPLAAGLASAGPGSADITLDGGAILD